MTRRVSKRGTVYTEGSQSTPEPGFPNVCSRCGERVFTSRQEFQHHTDDRTGEQFAWHIPRCPAPRVSAGSAERAPKALPEAN